MTVTKTVSSMVRTRWAAIGAAVAVSLGAGGMGLIQATSPDGASAFVPITPCRILDTRPEFQVGSRSAPLAPSDTHSVSGRGIVGQCTLPDDATGLSLNVTALDATLPTFITVWPTGEPIPNASSLNPSPGQPPTPNAVNTKLGADGRFSMFNLQGSVHVLADVVGYYTDHNHDHGHDDRYYTETESDEALAEKANTADVYTKTESDTRYLHAPTGSVEVDMADFAAADSATAQRWSFVLGWEHSGYDHFGSRACLLANPELPSGADIQSVDLFYTRDLPAAASTTTTFAGEPSPDTVEILIAQMQSVENLAPISTMRGLFGNYSVLPETGYFVEKASLSHQPIILDVLGSTKVSVAEVPTNQFVQICASTRISLVGVTIHFATS